jgi:hypothetical protein
MVAGIGPSIRRECDGAELGRPATRARRDTSAARLTVARNIGKRATPTSYAKSCKTLRLDLAEGVYRTALFKFMR